MLIVPEQDGVAGEFSESPAKGTLRCRYGFFTRHGGESRRPYSSLNVGLHVGDDENTVLANRESIKKTIGANYLLSALQVHGAKTHVQNEPLTQDLEVDGYDALITSQKGVALMVQHADCQAVLLYDSVAEVVAAVHNGWRGSVQNILRSVVDIMTRDYSSKPANVQAIVGPSLGPCCAEFIHHEKELPEEFTQFKVGDNHFDFWQISQKQLMDAGLKNTNIKIDGQCTLCSQDYFSYREVVQKGDGVTGRNGSVIVLHEV